MRAQNYATDKCVSGIGYMTLKQAYLDGAASECAERSAYVGTLLEKIATLKRERDNLVSGPDGLNSHKSRVAMYLRMIELRDEDLKREKKRTRFAIDALRTVLSQPFKGSWDRQAAFVSRALGALRPPNGA